MRKREIKSISLLVITLFFGVAATPNLHAASINFITDAVTTNPDNIQFTSDGVVVTVSGWQAEFPNSTTANVWGPFLTTAGLRELQIFGVETFGSRMGIGLSVQSTGSLTPSETDTGDALFQPFFDNIVRVGHP